MKFSHETRGIVMFYGINLFLNDEWLLHGISVLHHQLNGSNHPRLLLQLISINNH